MSDPRRHGSASLALAILFACACVPLPALALTQPEIVIDAGDAAAAEEILIEETPRPTDGAPGELIIEDATPAGRDETLVIEADTGPRTESTTDSRQFEIRIDDVRAEYGYLTRSGAPADNTLYGKISAFANWQPHPAWELQLAARADAHDQDGDNSFSALKADYGDSFVRYRADNLTLTLGTQTIVWGRMDELPLSDRVSTADLTRFILDDLEDRRRANPALRAEAFMGSGKLDLVWLFDFRPAELPDRDSIWYPIDRDSGRILGFDPQDLPPALVQGARISEDEPSGDGGFGARYTRSHSLADFGVTVANTRQSTPYFRAAGAGRIEAVYPRSWAYGADAAIDAGGATWRLEVLYSSDNPVTRTDQRYTTTPAIAWGGGVEFHPGDGDTRVNLQLMGMNLVDAPSVIDREDVYSLNGEVEVPFDRNRWRAKLGFYAGLGEHDVYLNPEIAFLGWEPHELYLAVHYFDGDDNTFGGFYEHNSSINLGWRAKF